MSSGKSWCLVSISREGECSFVFPADAHGRWSLFRNNNMATNLQTFTSNNGRKEGVLPHVAVEHRHLGGHCSEAVIADSGKARSFILCEEKHE